jgi:hypothetical protein
MFMEFWKGAVVLITANSIDQGAPKWVSITILFIGYGLDRLVKFFAYVEETEAKANVTVSFPAEMADKVTVTENATAKP